MDSLHCNLFRLCFRISFFPLLSSKYTTRWTTAFSIEGEKCMRNLCFIFKVPQGTRHRASVTLFGALQKPIGRRQSGQNITSCRKINDWEWAEIGYLHCLVLFALSDTVTLSALSSNTTLSHYLTVTVTIPTLKYKLFILRHCIFPLFAQYLLPFLPYQK